MEKKFDRLAGDKNCLNINTVERVLTDIWQEVLDRKKPVPDDNFFSIGGDSLQAVHVLSRVRERLALFCSVSDFFAHPTIAQLSQHLIAQKNEPDLVDDFMLIPADREQDLPLSYAQQRLWFLDQFESEQNSAYNIPIVLQFSGQLNIHALEISLNSLVRRHESLRTVFKNDSGVPSQVIVDPYTISIEPQEVGRDELETALARETEKPFILDRGPLLRVKLFITSPDHYALLICLHNIICDECSTWIFLQELSDLYRDYLQASSMTLPELETQYPDFSSWQKQWLQDNRLTGLVTYWKNQLQGYEDLELPTDHPRPATGHRCAAWSPAAFRPDSRRRTGRRRSRSRLPVQGKRRR